MSKIENTQKQSKSYELFLAILVGRNQDEIFTLKEIAERNCNEDRFCNTTFVVMEAFFDDKNYERFIEYQANAQCAQRHNLPNQQKTYAKNASDMIDAWATKMKGGNATFYLRGDSKTTVGSKMASTINNSIAPCIFEAGPEALEIIRIKHSVTYWKKASVKATVDAVLSFNTKQDIIAACCGPARHVEFLLQDSVDDNLDWKRDVDDNHPLKRVCDYIDEWLSGRHTNKNQAFNLGEKLIGLTDAPYGLFQGYAPMAMVAFAMRRYVNQIFDTNGKQRTAQHLVDDVVELFKAWENGKSSNKLNFMFESREAGKLSKHLISMFSLKKLKGYSDISSLKDARWAIQHEYAKEKGYPLWSLKYCSSDYNTEEMRLLIDNVIRVVNDSESMKNPSLLNDTISGYEAQKFEWGNLIVENSGSNYREGFCNFLKSVEIVNIQDHEIDEAFAYLKGHLEGEIGLWKEVDVKDRLKDWRMSKQEKGTISFAPDPTPDNTVSRRYTSDDITAQNILDVANKRSKLKGKLKLMPASDVKEALSEMIENEDFILDVLLKYLE